MRKIALIFFVVVAILDCRAGASTSETAQPGSPTRATAAPVDQLIPWLLNEDRQLRGIPFGEVIFDTTGKRVLAFNRQDETDQRVAKQISLNTTPGLNCDFPHTAQDRVLRSGYPDLRIVDLASKRVFYLDPKLYARGSRDSTFRTFYFEPKIATNKVRDDAVHFIAGIEHEPRKDGRWNFTRWDLVDLAQFKLKLKAEFQGSNRDMYRPEAIVATSAK
ncbi:MAG: hypothetical protein DME77_05040 [Verrucomicrobia bacterium]|nr:MAG: hypothetical protein DME77_05040 [Verrucomicrobiota bacterium]